MTHQRFAQRARLHAPPPEPRSAPAIWPSTARPLACTVSYFSTSHFIVTRDHLPPARSQSALLVCPEVGGLADGVVPRSGEPVVGGDPVEGPGAGLPAVASLPPPPVLPDPPVPVDGLPVPVDGPLGLAAPPVPDVPLPGVPLPAGSLPEVPLPAPGALEPAAPPLPA
jgi:hypothetical protein